ncbi:MAG: 2-amino-4-hydroxy-6-hydroxymethyldihydropteridine diphosphokinase [Bacteroidales bacterium]
MAKVYFTIGGNIGDREFNLGETRRLISERIGNISKESSIYESEPWGFDSEHNFLNQVLVVDTCLSPAAIMLEISYVETKMGRVRNGAGYASRTVDVDIIFYDHQIMLTPDLTVPHKQMHKRRFVLEPLNEIATDFIHPLFSLTTHELLVTCPDESKVWKYQPVAVGNC